MQANEFNFENRNLSVLTKRPNPNNQRKKTISLSMFEFAELVQGRYKTIEIYDSYNRLKKTLARESVLANATITPYVNHVYEAAFYLVNYSNV